jgi:hypothetical protein
MEFKKYYKEPPYKSEYHGQWPTQSLFYEVMQGQHISKWVYKPVFTLFEPKEGYISCQRTFVELGDPTGYEWAMKYLKSWNHWKRLMECQWFKDAYEQWCAELHAKNQADAIRRIQEIATTESPQALPANRYIAEQGWKKPTSKRGRPSAEELTGELKRAARAQQEHDDDMARIGLKVINGGKD